MQKVKKEQYGVSRYFILTVESRQNTGKKQLIFLFNT